MASTVVVNGVSPAVNGVSSSGGVNGVLPAKETAAAASRPSKAQAAGGVPPHRPGGVSSAPSGQPLNFSLPHSGAGPEELQLKKPEEQQQQQQRAASGGLYRPYSTSPTPPRTLPGWWPIYLYFRKKRIIDSLESCYKASPEKKNE